MSMKEFIKPYLGNLNESLELTHEHHKFELCGSFYTRIFFLLVNTVVLHNTLLVESMDPERRI